MNTLEDSRTRPLIRPFLYMLVFYLVVQNAVQSVLLLSGIFNGPNPFGTHGEWLLPLIILLPQALLGLLFIHFMDHGLRDHGFTVQSAHLYIRPAILLGVAAAAIHTVISLLNGIFMRGFGMLHPPSLTAMINPMFTNALFRVVQAFLLCGVMQEYISRRAGGQVRVLRWDIPQAGIAVSLIAVLYAAIPQLIYQVSHRHWPDPFGLAGDLVFGVIVLIWSYWYGHSRSLAAPVVAGAVFGILTAVFYNLAITSPIFNHMR